MSSVVLWGLFWIAVSYAHVVLEKNKDLDEIIWTKSSIGKIYYINKSPLAWSDADRECREKGSKLITVENQTTQDAVVELLKHNHPTLYWSGLSEDLFHQWTWDIGRPTFFNWASGQPYEETGLPGCALISPQGFWQVSDCEVERRSICEKFDDGVAYIAPPFQKNAHYVNDTEERKHSNEFASGDSVDIHHDNKFEGKPQKKYKPYKARDQPRDPSNFNSTQMLQKIERLRTYLKEKPGPKYKIDLPTTVLKRDNEPTPRRKHGSRTTGQYRSQVVHHEAASVRDFINDMVVKTTGGNSRERACVFPFISNGKTNFRCIKSTMKPDRKWCAVTNNYDRDMQWGYCEFADVGIGSVITNKPTAQILSQKAKEIESYTPKKISTNSASKPIEQDKLAKKLTSVLMERISENPAETTSNKQNAIINTEKVPTPKIKKYKKQIKALQNSAPISKPLKLVDDQISFPQIKIKNEKINKIEQSTEYTKDEYGNDKVRIHVVKYITTESPKNVDTSPLMMEPVITKNKTNDYVMNLTIELTKNLEKEKIVDINKSGKVTDDLNTYGGVVEQNDSPAVINKFVRENTSESDTSKNSKHNENRSNYEFNTLVGHILHQIKDVSNSEDGSEVFGHDLDFYEMINQPTYKQSVRLTHDKSKDTMKGMHSLDQIEEALSNSKLPQQITSTINSSTNDIDVPIKAEGFIDKGLTTAKNLFNEEPNKSMSSAEERPVKTANQSDIELVKLISQSAKEPIKEFNPSNELEKPSDVDQQILKNETLVVKPTYTEYKQQDLINNQINATNDNTLNGTNLLESAFKSEESSVFGSNVEEAMKTPREMLIGDSEKERSTEGSTNRLNNLLQFEDNLVALKENQSNTKSTSKNLELSQNNTEITNEIPTTNVKNTNESNIENKFFDSDRTWISTLEIMTKDGKKQIYRDNDQDKKSVPPESTGEIGTAISVGNIDDFHKPETNVIADDAVTTNLGDVVTIQNNSDIDNTNNNQTESIQLKYDSPITKLETTSDSVNRVFSAASEQGNKLFHDQEVEDEAQKLTEAVKNYSAMKTLQKNKAEILLSNKTSINQPQNSSVEGFNNEISRFVEKIEDSSPELLKLKGISNKLINSSSRYNAVDHSDSPETKLMHAFDKTAIYKQAHPVQESIAEESLANKEYYREKDSSADQSLPLVRKHLRTGSIKKPSLLERVHRAPMRTFGGNSNNGECVFPFVYDDNSYWNCIDVKRPLPWCATTSSYDVMPLWGFCCIHSGDCQKGRDLILSTNKKYGIEKVKNKQALTPLYNKTNHRVRLVVLHKFNATNRSITKGLGRTSKYKNIQKDNKVSKKIPTKKTKFPENSSLTKLLTMTSFYNRSSILSTKKVTPRINEEYHKLSTLKSFPLNVTLPKATQLVNKEFHEKLIVKKPPLSKFNNSLLNVQTKGEILANQNLLEKSKLKNSYFNAQPKVGKSVNKEFYEISEDYNSRLNKPFKTAKQILNAHEIIMSKRIPSHLKRNTTSPLIKHNSSPLTKDSHANKFHSQVVTQHTKLPAVKPQKPVSDIESIRIQHEISFQNLPVIAKEGKKKENRYDNNGIDDKESSYGINGLMNLSL